jgi:hypothetical protein
LEIEMKKLSLVLLLCLAGCVVGCASWNLPDARDCLVSVDGKCVMFGDNPPMFDRSQQPGGGFKQ